LRQNPNTMTKNMFAITFLLLIANAYGKVLCASDKCFKEHEYTLSWDMARDKCNVNGGELAIIKTYEELAVISTLVYARGSGATPFIGGRSQDTDVFHWTDGSIVRGGNWEATFPGYNECMAIVKGNGKFTSIDCDAERFFVCQYPTTEPTTSYPSVSPSTSPTTNPTKSLRGDGEHVPHWATVIITIVSLFFIIVLAGFLYYMLVYKKGDEPKPDETSNKTSNQKLPSMPPRSNSQDTITEKPDVDIL